MTFVGLSEYEWLQLFNKCVLFLGGFRGGRGGGRGGGFRGGRGGSGGFRGK